MKHNALILLYNNGIHLPFHFSSNLQTRGWRISMDRDLIKEASVVVFHLPTLSETLSDELEKQAGQLWIGWKRNGELSVVDNVGSIWDRVFDLYLSYSPRCYWLCAVTFGSIPYLLKKSYPLLDEITDWFRKVDFMIIGTQKGGSTALHDYLHQHPSCWGAYFKETDFFLFPNVYAKGISWYMGSMWKERIPLRYSLCNNLLFESTTWYSYWHEVPCRLFEYNPNLKFIFLVRNPIDRAYSQYNMLVQWSKNKLLYEYSLYPDKNKLCGLIDKLLDTDKYPFSYWIELEIEKINRRDNSPVDFFPDFLHRGIYYEQLERYYRFFPKGNIAVIESGELQKKRIPSLRKIECFLSIPGATWENMDIEEKFISHYNAKLPEDVRSKLKTFFEPYNERLYQLIGETFDWG